MYVQDIAAVSIYDLSLSLSSCTEEKVKALSECAE